jgi:hypothetical protein
MQIMYATLADGSNSDNYTTTGMQMEALVTTGSTLGNTYATPAQMMAQVTTSPELESAINLLVATYQALLQHMAAMSFHEQPSLQGHTFPMPQTTLFHVPPIKQLTISGMNNYNIGGFNQGQGSLSAGGRGCGWGCRGCNCMLFADHMAVHSSGFQGGSGAQPMFMQVGRFKNFNVQCMNPPHSNVTKK